MATRSKLTIPKAQVPYSRKELFQIGKHRTFTGESLKEIAFPIGGIGTGSISLGGRGNLRDWEIFNRPAKGKDLPMTFFAVWARPKGGQAVAKILERKVLPPYTHPRGHGMDRSNLGGVARLDEVVFRGEYPFAWLDFQDAELPVVARLEAFNPFIPLNADESSIPVAVFNWTFENPSTQPVELSLLAAMTNPLGWQDIGIETKPFPGKLNQFRQDDLLRGIWFTAPGLTPYDPNTGSAALTTSWPKVGAQTRLYRGGWWDGAHVLWDDFSEDGRLEPLVESEYRLGEKPSEGSERGETAALAVSAKVPAGGKVTVPILITWLFPYLKAWSEGVPARTYVSRLFGDAWDAARHTARNLPWLTETTRQWHRSLFDSSLPSFVIDAVSSQASIIRTNTCLRLADGQFYGWEGCSDDAGCCHGTCTHVWNYEQALAFLFPELERSIRRNEFLNSTDARGHMTFRTSMPANVRTRAFHACGDGQMGAIIRAYRDWQLSGDDAFLREIWPGLKRALEYAWTEPNGWDPDKDGVMEGCQHNTYDIEFYGPNTMMGAMYLGALRAAEEMAAHLGEREKALEYRAIYESGRKRTDASLWNGEYYIQKVKVMPGITVPEHLRGPAACEKDCACNETPGPKASAWEGFEVKYQYGEGCLSDQLLGQWACHVAGLGYVLDPKRVGKAVESVFRHNFRRPIGGFSNVQRIYAVNDEAGLLLCSWPHGNRPHLPFVYSDEVWTGIEYHVAAHLIYEGHLAEGLAVVKGVRDRHDGIRRNPWDEFECGHHYARAMSSWSVLLALCGYHYSAVEGRMRVAPKVSGGDFACAFTTGSGWGTIGQKVARGTQTVRVSVGYGTVTLRSLVVHGNGGKATARLDGRAVPASCRGGEKEMVEVALGEAVEVREGQQLTITLR